MDMPVTFDFSSCLDEYVHGYWHASQTVLRSNGALNWLLLAILDNDQQIQITPRLRLPPGIRTKKIDRFRVEFINQALGDLFAKGWRNPFHMGIS